MPAEFSLSDPMQGLYEVQELMKYEESHNELATKFPSD